MEDMTSQSPLSATSAHGSEDSENWTAMQEVPIMHNYILTSRTVWVYVSPVILITGFVGNLLALTVLLRRPLRESSTFCLLAALAVTDSVVLLNGLLRDWLSIVLPSTAFTRFNQTLGLCKPVEILMVSSMYCSAWLIVAVSWDRYMAVCRPVQAIAFRTPCRAGVIAGVTVIIATVAAISMTFISHDQDVSAGHGVTCFTSPSSKTAVWLDFSMYSLLPSVALFILNGRIHRTMLAHFNRRRSTRKLRSIRSQTPSSPGPQSAPCLPYTYSRGTPPSTSLPPELHKDHPSRSRQKKACLACVTSTVAVSYMVTTLPNSVLVMVAEICPELVLRESLVLVQTFTMLLWYSNHAVNFYLYCLTAKQVRLQILAPIHAVTERWGCACAKCSPL